MHLQTLGYPIANDVQYGGTYPGPRPPFLIPGTKAAQRLETERDQGSRHKRQKLEAAVSVQPEEVFALAGIKCSSCVNADSCE